MNDGIPPTQITDTQTSTAEAGSRSNGFVLTLKQIRELAAMTHQWPEGTTVKGELCDPDDEHGEDEYTSLRDLCYLTAAYERDVARTDSAAGPTDPWGVVDAEVDEPDHSMLKEDARNAAATEDAEIAERIRAIGNRATDRTTARFSIGPNVERPEHATWRVLFDTLDDAHDSLVSMVRGKDPLLGKDGPTGLFRRVNWENDWVYLAKTTQAAYDEGCA